jgi:branched-chain amino acid transport system substrate-binding protein
LIGKIVRKHSVFFSRWLSALLVAVSVEAAASDLVVVQVAPMTGPQAAGAMANYLGARAHFDQVNAQGGINGQKIRFVVEDDQYKPEETIRLLQQVAIRDKPLAFINLTGSTSISAVLKDKTLDRVGVPIIGVTPGSEALRAPGHPMLFHVHAGDRAQLKRIVSHLSTLGIAKIGVAHQDTPFGKAALGFIDELAPTLNTKVVARVSVASADEDLKPAVEKLRASAAQTYVMLLQPSSSAAFVRDARALGDKTPIYGMSYVSVKGLIDKASLANATGTALAQVTPNPSASTSGLTREFHATMDQHAPPGTSHSQLHLIGFLTARVTSEALRRAGTAPTAEKVALSLRQLRVDLGGYNIDFPAGGNNVGSQFVDIGVVDRTGRLMY